jgi:hypothetical protein
MALSPVPFYLRGSPNLPIPFDLRPTSSVTQQATEMASLIYGVSYFLYPLIGRIYGADHLLHPSPIGCMVPPTLVGPRTGTNQMAHHAVIVPPCQPGP